MRYRLASRRPGRNRPSFKENASELGGRDDGEEDARWGLGDFLLAYSIVAASSEARVAAELETAVSVASSDPTGAPHEAQKRLAMGTSVLQVRHRAMNFSAASVTRFRGGEGELYPVVLKPREPLCPLW